MRLFQFFGFLSWASQSAHEYSSERAGPGTGGNGQACVVSQKGPDAELYDRQDLTQHLWLGVFYTDVEDQIQRLLTGNVNADGEGEVTRAKVGNGELYGAELKARRSFSEHSLALGHCAWLDGRISAEARAGERAQRDHHSRMMPTNYRLGVR